MARVAKRAGRPWIDGEEELLIECFDAGLSLDVLCWIFQRQQGGIKARLRRLERIEFDHDERCYLRIDRTPLPLDEWPL